MQQVFQVRSAPDLHETPVTNLQGITGSTGLLTVILFSFYAPPTSQATKGQSSMGGFNWGAFLLLGVDSLIACIITGPMFIRQPPREHNELRSPDEQKRASRRKWWALAGLSVLTVP
jgi:hypothetical protein